MIDGVIFDLDGTLWDTTDELVRCWQQYLPDLTIWKLKSIMGFDDETIANELSISLETVNLIQESEIKWLSDHVVQPYVGVVGVLQYLQSRNIPCFIVSNCQSRYIECFLYTNNLETYFKDWSCYGDTHMHKSYNAQKLMQKYNLNDVIFVGDTMNDKNAAKLIGAKFIWATYGFGHVEYYDGWIHDPLGLMRYI